MKSCRPPSSPSPIPAPIWVACATRAVTRWRCLSRYRQQDLDHPSGPRRHHDAACPHRSRARRATRACRCSSPRSRAAPMTIHSRHQGMSGSEIEVLGYRGMKEYRNPLRGFRGQGGEPPGRRRGPGLQAIDADFRIGAHPDRRARPRRRAERARSRLALCDRPRQFGKPIVAFPRIADKLALMAAEIMATRQLVYHAARDKDAGRRCDLEAGMAKLLARARRLVRRRQCASDSWRQRLCARIRDLAGYCAMPASSIFSKVPLKSRRRSSPADCWIAAIDRENPAHHRVLLRHWRGLRARHEGARLARLRHGAET